jgi:hypothetical protein
MRLGSSGKGVLAMGRDTWHGEAGSSLPTDPNEGELPTITNIATIEASSLHLIEGKPFLVIPTDHFSGTVSS